MSYVGRSVPRVDARDKAAGRAMYAADLCDRRALTAKILHAEQAHALVKRIDAEKARAMDGVEAVFTCFDVPKNYFPTAGHPWSTEPEHQDVADRLLLTDHVRFWGDEIAVVVAQDELTAQKALREIEVEYEPLPFVLDVQKAMEPGAAGTTRPPSSTATSKITTAGPIWRAAASWSSPPHRYRTSSAASSARPWAFPGGRCASSSPT